MKVPPFTDIGKDAKDVIHGGKNGLYQYNSKVKITSKAKDGVEFNLGATLKDDKLSGDSKIKYKAPHGVDIEVGVDSNSKVTVSTTAADVAPGLKATLAGSVPSIKSSGKLTLEYSIPHLMVKSNIGLTATPTVDVAATAGQNNMFMGGMCSFSTAASEIKSWAVGAGYLGAGYSAGVLLTDKGDTVKASYSHVMAPGQTAALEVTRQLKSTTTTFTLGYQRVLANKALAKVKLDNNGICGVLYEQSLDPMTKLTLCGSFNATNLNEPAKYGVSLALNN